MSMILFWIGSVFFVFWFCLGFVLVCFFVLVLFFVSFVWLFFSFVSVPDLVSVAIIFLFVFCCFFVVFFLFCQCARHARAVRRMQGAVRTLSTIR